MMKPLKWFESSFPFYTPLKWGLSRSGFLPATGPTPVSLDCCTSSPCPALSGYCWRCCYWMPGQTPGIGSTIFFRSSGVSIGPITRLIVTPQIHRVHHSLEWQEANSNFASFLSLWDRLFGTAAKAAPQQFGVPGMAGPDHHNVIGLIETPLELKPSLSCHSPGKDSGSYLLLNQRPLPIPARPRASSRIACLDTTKTPLICLA